MLFILPFYRCFFTYNIAFLSDKHNGILKISSLNLFIIKLFVLLCKIICLSMLYVFLSVCCSVIVSVIIKLAQKRRMDVQQLVLWNYPITVFLTWFLLKPDFHLINISDFPYHLYIPLAILLPTMFIFIALSIRYSGIVKTDVAQRMSIFIPLLASYFLFGENLQSTKILGLGVGLTAVVCSIDWSQKFSVQNKFVGLYPLMVFGGMGIIDVLFKQIALYEEVPYITSMFIVFVLAMFVSFVILSYRAFVFKNRVSVKVIVWGLLMGVFNFGNIYLYMKAHRSLPDNPSIVFLSMNIGVIVLGGLIGVFLFKEKLSKINQFGLILAIIAIFLITYL